MSASEDHTIPPANGPGAEAPTEPALTTAPILSADEQQPGMPPGEPGSPAAVAEDLHTPWGWPDLILFVVFVLGSSVVLPILAGLVAVLWWGVKPWEIETAPNAQAAILFAGQALWSVATLAYLFATVRLRHGGPFWRTIGWRTLRPLYWTGRVAAVLCLLGGVGLALAIQFSSVFVGKRVKLPIEKLYQTRQSALLLMVLGILVAPLIEETIFRGYIYPVLARGLGMSAGVVVTGILFGMVHAPQLWGGWGQIALIVAVGIVLTYVRARTGTVLASFLVHLSYNTTLFVELYVTTGGLRHFPGSA